MAVVLKNNVVGYLAYAFNAGDTVLRLRTNDGLKFPSLDAPDYFYATLSSATQSDIMEIVKVTYRMNDNLSVVRAQEDTVELSFPIGTKVELRVTAKSIKDAIGEVDVTSNVEAAQAAAQAAALSAANASTSADDAGAYADAALTSSTNAATSAGNSSQSAGQASTFAGQASTSASNAAGSASAANISSGTAAGSASAAAGSAAAAAGSAGSASTFASNASTSAGQASQSQSAASGSASSANISATAAAASSFNASGDATNAGISASAASTSASNAATSASAAGVSATASQTSSVSAQSVANRLIPERVSVASDFAIGTFGEPSTVPPTTTGTVVAVAGEGDVRELTIAAVFSTRGALAVGTGRTFRLQSRMQATVNGTPSIEARSLFAAYDASWTYLGLVSLVVHDTNLTVAEGWQNYSQETTSTAVLAAWPTATYLRGRAGSTANNGGTWQIAYIRFQDITNEAAAAGSASAAAVSASTATTKAGEAGQSATASQTSSVSAQSVANRLLPDRPAVGADFTSFTEAGNPSTTTPLSQGVVVAVNNEGDVRELNTRIGIYTRGVLAVVSNRTYRVTVRKKVTVDGANNRANIGFQAYNSSYVGVGYFASIPDASFTIADGWQTFTYERTGAQILAAIGTTAYIRGVTITNDTAAGTASGATTQVAIVGLADVTSESSAAGSATAAATSASNASTSASDAGQFASAASGSATTASTQAGNAATSAGQAATSESNASGHAGTASTQAGLASTSAVSAQTVANNLVPNRPSVAADYTNSLGTGDPSAIGAFTGGTVVAVAGEGDVRQVTTTTTIQTRGWLPVVAGATYRRRYRSRVLVEGTSNVLRAGINIYSQTGTSLGFITFNTDDPAHVIADGWVTFDTETTAAAILAAQPTAAYVRAFGIFAGKSDNSASGATVQVAILEIANITSLAAAAGSATAAAASATTASTKAGEASNSATAASSSSLAAKSTAIAQGIDASDFSADGLFWTNTFGGAASAAADPIGTYANISGEGRVLQSTISGTGTVGYYLTQKYALTPRAGRKYKLTARIRVTADATGGGVLSSNFHVNGLNTTLNHGNPTFTGTAVAGFNTSINPINIASGWQNISIIYMLGTPGSFDVFWRPRIDFIRTGAGSTGGSFETAFFRIEDVTDSEAATLAASAAATSSSNASTSAGQASGFATAASGSATTASTQAGNAATSAGQASTSAGNAATSESNASTSAGNAAGSASTASTQASNASGFATQASSSATLSATFASGSQGSINSSATFADNLNATGVPTNWIDWANATGAGTRVTGIAPQPYAFRLSSGAGASAGIRQILSGRISTGWHVLEADITLNSGALTGAGLLLNADPASAYTEYLLNFSTDKDTNGSVIGAGTAGTLYKFRKLVQSAVGVTQSSIYAMSHYTSFGSIASANDITWHRCAVRVASQAEIEARAATNDVVGLTSSVSTNSSAISTVDGKLSASYALTVDAGGRIASMKLLSDGTTSTVKFTASTFQIYNNTTDEAPFEVVGGVVKIKSANVGTLNVGSGGITIQSGPSGPRIVISNSVIEVYDAVRLRVRMGIWT